MNVIGVSCPDFGAEPFSDMWAEIAKEFSHWEIFSEANDMIQKIDGELLSGMDSHHMTYSIHSAIADTNLAAVNDRMREASVMEIMSEMQSAQILGINTITVHPGLTSLSVNRIRDRSLSQAQQSMRMLDKASYEFGVNIAVENMPQLPFMLGCTAKELAQIIDGTDLGVCFDIGHANTTGQIDAMLDTFRGRLMNVHIHDNLGQKDQHLTIGEGNIDFGHVLARLKDYAHRYIIESKNLSSAIVSKGRLKQMLGQ
ncbi:MAG: sugar phosphate isomerase/epimerase [Candidatus Methanomethylophilus sp.]|nr:sugar phosphate isomerase/epimerase [Methanomethylophilus sp.]MDD3232973.1 sugar phosphate isomerase/epimerase [Methanomethylophilus sp.]MDD4221888.1 sugar phosphate isomerase/epimerase [Methanomethylophilus sp.]MDD4668661.1 sugar phosphate isomerase/epimerase [Methanomethylophilus sp.]